MTREEIFDILWTAIKDRQHNRLVGRAKLYRIEHISILLYRGERPTIEAIATKEDEILWDLRFTLDLDKNHIHVRKLHGDPTEDMIWLKLKTQA